MITTEPTRRRALGLITRGGIVFVGALAGLAATRGDAKAIDTKNCNCPRNCCCLATCRRCTQNGCNFSCPRGWTKTAWICAAGARPIMCGECQKGGDPRNCITKASEYYCSIWIDQNAC
jgi:hypothetical protein